MPDNRSQAPAEPRPTLLLCCTIIGVIAVLSAAATIILTALDANAMPDLPDPLVNNVGDLAASTSVICMILLGIHILQRTSAENTRAGIATITAARTDLLRDTGEIHGLAEQIRQPEIILLREAVHHHLEQVDRSRVMRVLDEAEAQLRHDATEHAELEYAQRYQDLAQPQVPSRPRLVPDVS